MENVHLRSIAIRLRGRTCRRVERGVWVVGCLGVGIVEEEFCYFGGRFEAAGGARTIMFRGNKFINGLNLDGGL